MNTQLFIVQGHQNKKCWMGRWHERTSGFLHMIHQAIITAPPGSIPNIEFVLDLDDDPQRPIDFAHGKDSNQTTVWGLTRLAHQRHIWLLPDYAYWAWPSALVASHGQVRRNVREINAAYPWEKKYNKAVWRGDANLNQIVRKQLINTAKDTAWGDVRVCDIYNTETKQYCMTQDQLCRYKFPIHTEGYTYSGRLKYLQLCNSAPVVHKLRYLEHHHGLMRSSGPQQNYIEVEKDWSDLDEKVESTKRMLIKFPVADNCDSRR
jgi:protein glucosyltransferase